MRDKPQEARHPIQVVARRTGLTADSIRAWEKRYGAVAPARTPTNRRRYSEDDVHRLRLLHRATLTGRSIGEVAGMETTALERLVASDETAAAAAPVAPRRPVDLDAAPLLEECLDAARQDDPARLRTALVRAALDLGPVALFDNVLGPLMTTVGDGWRRGSVEIWQEHLITAAVRAVLIELRQARSRPFAGPEIAVATPAGELHEIGALIAAAIAAMEGWSVTYLGTNLPAREIANAARRQTRAVALSIVQTGVRIDLVADLRSLRRELPGDIAILCGGRAAADYESVLQEIGARVVGTTADLRSELARLRELG